MEIKNDLAANIKTAENFVKSKKGRTHFDKNNLNFADLKNKGVVYFIFVTDKKTQQIELKYIGKSRGSLFRQRLINHFDHSHEQTATKRTEVEKEIEKKNKVEYSYLTTQPESLRNLIEEELILLFKEKANLWNGKKRETNKQ